MYICIYIRRFRVLTHFSFQINVSIRATEHLTLRPQHNNNQLMTSYDYC